MYARSITIRGNPQAMVDGIAYIRDEVMPAVQQMDGCVGLSMLCDRESGRSITTTAWADSEALHRSADGVMAIGQRAAEIMAATSGSTSGRSVSCTASTSRARMPAPG